MALGADGSLYFADTHNHRIRRIDFSGETLSDNMVTTVAGTGEPGFSGDGGPASAAAINFPQDMEIGPDGRLYFADTNNHRVRRIDLEEGTIETVAGSGEKAYLGDGGQARDAAFNRPFGIAFDADGALYVSDTFNGRIRKVILESR